MSTVETKPKTAKTVKVVKTKPVEKVVEESTVPIVKKPVTKKEKLPSKVLAKEEPVSETPVPAPVPVPPLEQKNGNTDSTENEDKISRKKKNYNQLLSEVDNLNSLVEKYVIERKDSKKNDLSKFLKNLEKGLKKVKIHVQKIGKNKNSSTTSTNVQSGFQKPVKISDAVAQFTGWDVAQPRARVEVTNFVCDYVKQNNLQSPDDRRNILADTKLSELLDYNKERDGNLTYATIQKLLAKHYSPVTTS